MNEGEEGVGVEKPYRDVFWETAEDFKYAMRRNRDILDKIEGVRKSLEKANMQYGEGAAALKDLAALSLNGLQVVISTDKGVVGRFHIEKMGHPKIFRQIDKVSLVLFRKDGSSHEVVLGGLALKKDKQIKNPVNVFLNEENADER